MISKETFNNLRDDNLKVNLKDIREVSKLYKDLNELKNLVDLKMKKIKPILIENKVYELFPEDHIKVQFFEGRSKSFIDVKKVSKEVSPDDFLKMVTITEKSIKDVMKKEATRIIGLSKKQLQETISPIIKVSKMTKDELKESSSLPKGVL
jgi:hypothetical protein